MKKNKRKSFYFRKKYKYINGTKGVISLFLAILMVPFASIAGELINAARINSAVAIFDEALCNASNSTLGTYDKFLRSRFGLMATQQDYEAGDFLKDTFVYYMNENTNILSNTYTNAEYDVKGVYPLANQDVLLTQVLEYSKYSVPAKMLEEGLEIDNLIKLLEKNMPGKNILKLITAGGNTADKVMALGEKFDVLKEKVAQYETALNEYNAAYTDFSNEANTYILKKQEYSSAIATLEQKVEDEKNKEESKDIIAELLEMEKELDKIVTEKKKNWQTKKKELETQIKQFKEDNKDSLNEYLTALTNLNNKISERDTKMAEYLTSANAKRDAYSEKIENLKGTLSAVGIAIENVQGSVTELSNTIVNDIVTVGGVAIDKAKSENDDKIKDLNKKMETASETEKKEYQAQIDKWESEKADLSNANTLLDAEEKGAKKGLNQFNDSIQNYSKASYDTLAALLGELKGRVSGYNVENESGNIEKSIYYVDISGCLTLDVAKAIEEELLNSFKNSVGLSIIKAILGFIKALFDISFLFDHNLNGVIDSKYYEEKYGGLPSEKDRTVYPLSSAEEGDKELSDSYKELFGDYSEILDPLGSFSLMDRLEKIGEDIDTIQEETKLSNLIKIWDIGNTIKKIFNAISDIVINLTEIIVYFTTSFIQDVKQKTLLTGYLSYMLSDRTTYESGKSLTGEAFNKRGAPLSDLPNVPGISDFAALFSSASKIITGEGKDKCFIGAETEYIIFGSKTEVVNQLGAFGMIYAMRLLCDLPVIFADTEVNAVCAAAAAGTFGIGGPVVRLLYVLLEPLADTILLVNGETIPLIKISAYLTPAGIGDFIEKISTLGLNKVQLESVQNDLAKDLGMSDYSNNKAAQTPKSPLSALGNVFDISYSQMLMLVMSFLPRETLMNRLSNIIEMEAVENAINNLGGSATEPVFDLDNSFMFLRISANFETNEFIPISERPGALTSKKRIVYRGY